MKTTQKDTIKIFDLNEYKSKINEFLGKAVVINVLSGGKKDKAINGTVVYVSNECFGVKVKAGSSSFVSSYSFRSLFGEKISIELAKKTV